MSTYNPRREVGRHVCTDDHVQARAVHLGPDLITSGRVSEGGRR